jgi:hypothetical protein
LKGFRGFCVNNGSSQGRILALTVLCVPDVQGGADLWALEASQRHPQVCPISRYPEGNNVKGFKGFPLKVAQAKARIRP